MESLFVPLLKLPLTRFLSRLLGSLYLASIHQELHAISTPNTQGETNKPSVQAGDLSMRHFYLIPRP